jgi:hypothetical protein
MTALHIKARLTAKSITNMLKAPASKSTPRYSSMATLRTRRRALATCIKKRQRSRRRIPQEQIQEWINRIPNVVRNIIAQKGDISFHDG